MQENSPPDATQHKADKRDRHRSQFRSEIQATLKEYRANQDKDSRREDRRYRLERVALAVAAIYAAVAFFQLRAMKDTVDVTRRNLEISQRAWIISKGFATLNPPPQATDRKMSMPLTIENSGRTPAIRVRPWGMIGCAKALPDKLDWSLLTRQSFGPQEEATIGPGQQRAIVKESDLHPECLMADVIAGRMIVFGYGVLAYEDEFRTPRGLTFCGIFLPKTNTFEFCGHDNVPW